LGAPSATTTIQGDQIPAPDPKFGGVIKEDVKDSKTWWPPRVVPPKGAPNVLLILTDDQGYGVSSTFGGVIPTPAVDRIAKAGLRYTQFHSTALCSPSRAALITGRNHHSVGFGVIYRAVDGLPGYDSIIGSRTRPSAGSFRTTAMPRRGSARTTTRRRFQYGAVQGPSTNGRRGWASSTSTASKAENRQWKPVLVPRSHSDFSVDRQAGYNLTPTWRTRRSRY
jgi:arylsulfatase